MICRNINASTLLAMCSQSSVAIIMTFQVYFMISGGIIGCYQSLLYWSSIEAVVHYVYASIILLILQ